MINILIADDHIMVHQQIKFLFSSEMDFEVVGEARSGQEAVQMTRELCPDVVLMDIRMPGISGIEAARLLIADLPELKIIFLTNYDLDAYREAAAAIGASDYILKETMFKTLVPAIQEAINPRNHVDNQKMRL
jgi:DNA-binding NarL/FixJ family response regulator